MYCTFTWVIFLQLHTTSWDTKQGKTTLQALDAQLCCSLSFSLKCKSNKSKIRKVKGTVEITPRLYY